MPSGWISWRWVLIRISQGNIIMSSGWHTLLFLSHPDDFSQHVVALQRLRMIRLENQSINITVLAFCNWTIALGFLEVMTFCYINVDFPRPWWVLENQRVYNRISTNTVKCGNACIMFPIQLSLSLGSGCSSVMRQLHFSSYSKRQRSTMVFGRGSCVAMYAWRSR